MGSPATCAGQCVLTKLRSACPPEGEIIGLVSQNQENSEENTRIILIYHTTLRTHTLLYAVCAFLARSAPSLIEGDTGNSEPSELAAPAR